MKLREEVIHLADDLSFVAQIHIVICIWDHDDAGTWHAAAEIVSPCGTACFVVRNQSSLSRTVRQAIPVVRASIDSESGNRNARILLHTEVECRTDRRTRRQWRHIGYF